MTEELTKETLERRASKWNSVKVAGFTAAAAFIIGVTVPMACDTYVRPVLDQYDNLNEQLQRTQQLINDNKKEFGDLYDATQDSTKIEDLDTRMFNLQRTEAYNEAIQGKKAEKVTKAAYVMLGVLFACGSLGTAAGAGGRQDHYENRLRSLDAREKGKSDTG